MSQAQVQIRKPRSQGTLLSAPKGLWWLEGKYAGNARACVSSACSSSYQRVMESLKRIDSEEKENNNEVGAWSLGAWRSGEAPLLYQPVNQTITRGKGAPLTNNPTPPYLLCAFT